MEGEGDVSPSSSLGFQLMSAMILCLMCWCWSSHSVHFILSYQTAYLSTVTIYAYIDCFDLEDIFGIQQTWTESGSGQHCSCGMTRKNEEIMAVQMGGYEEIFLAYNFVPEEENILSSPVFMTYKRGRKLEVHFAYLDNRFLITKHD